jgi:Fic family protein
MKKPLAPPIVNLTPDSLSWLSRAIDAAPGPLVEGRYLHWDELRHRTPPAGLTHEQWWLAVKMRRRGNSLELPCTDREGRTFRYALVEPIPQGLHEIDVGAGSWVRVSAPILDAEMKDQYYVRSLIEEAITSSQLEGAVTTRRVAKEMIRTGRRPRNRSEQMIVNNYETMRRLGKLKDQNLTPDLVFEIHRLISRDTMDDPHAVGRLRRTDEPIVVQSEDDGTIYHWPPNASELPARLQAMCEFGNGDGSGGFVHPVLRSIVLHFWLAYDHPFVDGNGRTARALFYWSMLHHGYWLFEFVSISEIILKAPAQYYMAFLHTETDDNDLTYFLLHQLDVVYKSMEFLHRYIERKSKETREVAALMKRVRSLNHRQQALIAHAVRHPAYRYSINGHRLSHGVVYETARSDLMSLVRKGLLRKLKVGKTLYFEPVSNLTAKLAGDSQVRPAKG